MISEYDELKAEALQRYVRKMNTEARYLELSLFTLDSMYPMSAWFATVGRNLYKPSVA